MYHPPTLNKVPGNISTMKKEKQGYIECLEKLTKSELEELRGRQLHLLSNKSRLSKLPDKGAKIQNFYDKIVKQLKVHDDVEKASEIFSKLNITSVGKKVTANMEWDAKYSIENEAVLDSDDDENENIDPLKILAAATDTQKQIKYIKPQKPLITEADLAEIEEFKTELNDRESTTNMDKSAAAIEENNSHNPLLEPHAVYLCKKENVNVQKEKYMPYKTTRTNVHDPEKEKYRSKHKHWENTSATPPLTVHGLVKLITLEDSIRIEAENNKNLKSAKEHQAQERLIQRAKINEIIAATIEVDTMSPAFKNYRDHVESESEDNECTEEEDNDEGNSEDD